VSTSLNVMNITRLSEELDPNRVAKRVWEIFFLTSRPGVHPIDYQKEDFFYSWAGWYLETAPEQTLLIRNEDKRIVGYLVGCLDSTSARRLYQHLFYYQAFAHCYSEYPSHFHVNCDPDFQSVGFGGALVKKFVSNAADSGVTGVHVVTGATAKNRSFYDKLEFIEYDQKLIGNSSLVFLGKKL
jgi:GNAT superfamily N-acetyltransferase